MKGDLMNKGFTLLEMMIVLTVISIIFLLTVPDLNHVMSIIHDKSCENQQKVVDTAILQYQLKYDIMPDSIDDLISEGLLSEKQTECRNGYRIVIEDGISSIQ